MPKTTLTDKLAANLTAGTYWDQHPDAPRGFLLWVGKPAQDGKSARTYRLNYYNRDGVERRTTVGSQAAWPVKDARKAAGELLRGIDQGRDPLAEAEAYREASTVAKLAQDYEKEALAGLAASTQIEHRAMLRDWIIPALGQLKVAAVTSADVAKLHRKVTDAGYKRRANATLSLVSVLLNFAKSKQLRADNPAVGVKRNVEPRHERYLSGAETARLIDEVERRRALGGHWRDNADAILIALYTGARRGEILGMRWRQIEDLDGDAPVWVLPSTSTKEGKTTGRNKRLPLSTDAVAVAQRRKAEMQNGNIVRLPDDSVFAHGNTKRGQHSLEEGWQRIRVAAGIADVRFHDLRHSYASFAIARGLSLPIVGALLGHTQAATTQRYAHLADDTLRAATALVGQAIGGKRG